MTDQCSHSIHIAFEASQVQRCKLIFKCARVHPLFYLLVSHMLYLFCERYKCFNFARDACIHSMVEQCETFVIDLLDYGDWTVLDLVTQLCIVCCLKLCHKCHPIKGRHGETCLGRGCRIHSLLIAKNKHRQLNQFTLVL